jgi:hypothetical protein
VTVAIAALALAFVAYMVPWRDHVNWPLDAVNMAASSAPHATHTPHKTAKPTRVSVEDHADGSCTIAAPEGALQLEAAACRGLAREPGLNSTAQRAKPVWILALVLLYFAGTLFWAMRWRALLTLARVRLPTLAVWRVVIEAQAGGVLLPGGVGGDALRIAKVGAEPGANLPKVAASVFLDRVVGLVTVCLSALCAGAASGGMAGFMRDASVLMVPLVAIPLGFVVVWTLLRKTRYAGSERFAQSRVGRLFVPMLAYAREPGGTLTVARSTLLSVLVSLTQLGVIRGLAFAIGASPTSEAWVFAGAAFTFMVSALPSLPGAWGTGDAAFVFFLKNAGLAPSQSLAICLLFRMCWYLSAVVGATLSLGKRGVATGVPSPGTGDRSEPAP